jgi:hypothetical protein
VVVLVLARSEDDDFEVISDDDSSALPQQEQVKAVDTLKKASKKRKNKKREAIAGKANALLERIDLIQVEKSDTATAFLKESLGKQALFASMDEMQLGQFVRCMAAEELQPGYILMNQGDIGDKFYVVDSGTLTCSITGVGVVAEYTRGESFGELALLYDTPRAVRLAFPPPTSKSCLSDVATSSLQPLSLSVPVLPFAEPLTLYDCRRRSKSAAQVKSAECGQLMARSLSRLR